LLAVIKLIEERFIYERNIYLSPELAYQFLALWEVVASRGRQIGRVELPFYYLQSDGVWELQAKPGYDDVLGSIRPRSVPGLLKVVAHAKVDADLWKLITDKADDCKAALISSNYFTNNEIIKLRSLFGLHVGDDPSVCVFENVISVARDIRFRLSIVPLYRYTCSLCGIRILSPSGHTLVEAAHIHPHSKSRDDSIGNGFALCRNHHWAFDAGLWAVDDDYRAVISATSFSEQGPPAVGLINYHSSKLMLDWITDELRPRLDNFVWHRANVFQG